MRDRHRASGPEAPANDVRPVELVFALDDEEAPTEVTVFPERGVDETTAWITMDVEHVVDLAERA